MAAPYNAAMVNNVIRQHTAARGEKTALAKALGVTAQTVTKWVQDETTPDPERWPAIERALGLAPATLSRAAGFAVTQSPRAFPDMRQVIRDQVVAVIDGLSSDELMDAYVAVSWVQARAIYLPQIPHDDIEPGDFPSLDELMWDDTGAQERIDQMTADWIRTVRAANFQLPDQLDRARAAAADLADLEFAAAAEAGDQIDDAVIPISERPDVDRDPEP